ncbi:MAG TPA: hypothetical protein VJS92_16080 [Candidatus Polarisedimenticolaceae bacterium]|nr:hypothetical protein [Candidatus Polarisedimenticolaceae bacterium]
MFTPSGNVNYVCHGRISPAPPETIVLNDIPCSAEFGSGTAQIVATRSGEVKLTCRVHPS